MSFEQPPPSPEPIMASPPAADPSGMTGMFKDPSTLASTGFLAAVLFAVVAGVFNFIPAVSGDIQAALLALTTTVDVGDVAVLGIAVALLVVTPDPPGGIDRTLLLKAAALLGTIITVYGVIRAGVVMSDGALDIVPRFASFIATLGVALAAATVAFYAFKEAAILATRQSTDAA